MPENNIAQNAPLEIERKFLIKYPEINVLEAAEGYSKTHIVQTYLTPQKEGGGLRIRKRGLNGIYEYTKTFKRDITPIKRIEIESKISKEEYDKLILLADKRLNSIDKYRHCFMYCGKLFELDTYSFWSDRATLEIELESEDESFTLPPFIEIIKEVTQDLRYRNRSLAENIIIEQIVF